MQSTTLLADFMSYTRKFRPRTCKVSCEPDKLSFHVGLFRTWNYFIVGTTNFHAALSDIESILQMIEANVATDFGRDVIKLTSSLDKISSTQFEALLEGSNEEATASSN